MKMRGIPYQQTAGLEGREKNTESHVLRGTSNSIHSGAMSLSQTCERLIRER